MGNENRRKAWALGIAFLLCTVEMQRHWNEFAGLLFLCLGTYVGLLWVGWRMNLAGIKPLIGYSVETTVFFLLLFATGQGLVQGFPNSLPVFSGVMQWSVLLAAWWGLSSERLHLLKAILVITVYLAWQSLGFWAAHNVINGDILVITLLTFALARTSTMAAPPSPAETMFLESRMDSFHEKGTGLFNRNYMGNELSHMSSLAQRYEFGYSLIIFQVDDFPRLRIKTGEDNAADIEKRIGWQISDRVRTADTVTHSGNGRFIVLLPFTKIDQARKLADGLCLSVKTAFAGEGLKIKLLAGVAENNVKEEPAEIIDAAEKDMALRAV